MSEFTLSPTPEKRRLAAVVFTDVVGYSARMQRDEADTIARVEADFNRMRAVCFQQDGEVLNSMGDGLLLCFSSAAQAASFALNVQDEFWSRKEGLPAGETLEHRIGIHLGDVVFLDNGTVAGDGVNIAARLEGKAPYGGICVSQSVYEAVKRKVPMNATFIGPEKFKNIAEPIPVWHIWSMGMPDPSKSGFASTAAAGTSTSGVAEPTMRAAARKPDAARPSTSEVTKVFGRLAQFKGIIAAIAGAGAVLGGLAGYWNFYQAAKVGAQPTSTNKAEAAAGPLSVVVLPFANLTGDDNQSYVADGLTSSVTADLSRIRNAFVVNTATAFTYKDKPVTAQQVGRDLGVRFVLQGSVQRSGSQIRINAQLADATSNAQLWSESFEGDQANLFALQDQVTTRIGNSIGREIVIAAARESEMHKSSPKVADLLLRARALYLKPKSLKNFEEIEALSRQALELEPNNSDAMLSLASALVLQVNNFGTQIDANVREKKYVEGRDLALRAKELDSDNPSIYTVLGVYAEAHDDYAASRRAKETRLSLEPKNPSAYNNLAYTLIKGGEPQKAIELLKQALTLEPKHPNEVLLQNMGEAYFMLGDNDATIEWFLKSLEVNTKFPDPYVFLAMAYELKGDFSKARAAVSDLKRVSPKFKLTEFRTLGSSSPAAYKEWYERKYLPLARKAGLPE